MDNKGPENKPPALPKFGDIASQASAAIGTFSSFGLSQLGAGGVIQRIAVATERLINRVLGHNVEEYENEGGDWGVFCKNGSGD